jgi:drug/metabolite transporter (DMT)-like permease
MIEEKAWIATMASFVMPVPTREEVRRGIIYIVASIFVFALTNALIKWLVVRYSVVEIVVFRSSFALVPCVYLVATRGGILALRTKRLHQHVTRSVMQFVSMGCIFTAFGLMPLADATAITFASPLFLTMLSIPLLGEQVGVYRWSAVIVGFAGVLIMVQPGPGLLHSGALFPLANALINACVTVAIRRMTLTEASTTLVFYQTLVTGLIGLVLLPFFWTTPDLLDLALFSATGLLSGIAQFWWMQGCRFVPAAVAAPFSYTSMIWSLALGYLVWSDVPRTAVLAGATIVIASGLYILYRETIRRVPKPAITPAAP